MEDLISIVNRLNERGQASIVYKKILRWTKRVRLVKLMFHLFAAFAEFERNLILERFAAGRAAARARGRLGGRPEKIVVSRCTLDKSTGKQWHTHKEQLLHNGMSIE